MPAGTEVAIKVSAGVSGTHLLSPIPNLYVRKRMSVANGLVEIRPTVLFRIMVANFADKNATLAKNEVLSLPSRLRQKCSRSTKKFFNRGSVRRLQRPR